MSRTAHFIAGAALAAGALVAGAGSASASQPPVPHPPITTRPVQHIPAPKPPTARTSRTVATKVVPPRLGSGPSKPGIPEKPVSRAR